MHLFKKFLLLALIFSGYLNAQTFRTGDLQAHLDSIVGAIPGSALGGYVPPSTAEMADFKAAIGFLLQNDAASAAVEAIKFDYQVLVFTDTANGMPHDYQVLQMHPDSSNFWGTFVFNPTPCRSQLIIQSPHPVYDTNTGYEGAFVFIKTQARAFMVSGAHRCNVQMSSTCDGTTFVCPFSSNFFRISDQPHVTDGPLHGATQVCEDELPSAIFLQLHGFGKQPTDPYMILSNGSRDTPTNDYILSLANELSLIDTVLDAKIAHIDTSWTRLIGFTNTQGRLLNGSPEPCNTAGVAGSGRFIHFEQEKSRLRADSIGWNKVALALSKVFICDTTGTGMAELASSQKDIFRVIKGDGSFLELELRNSIPGDFKIEILNMQGQILGVWNFTGKFGTRKKLEFNLLSKGFYLIRAQNGDDFQSKKWTWR